MKAIIILTTAVFMTACASTKVEYVKRSEGKSRFKAISKNYKSIETAYQEIHDDCQKNWQTEFGRLGETNASFSVEIISLDKANSFLSALCVATTYEVSQLDEDLSYE